MRPNRIMVLGCPVDAVTMTEAVEQCWSFAKDGRARRHIAVNAAKIVSTWSDTELRAAVRESDLITADGQAVVWAAKLLGSPLPERVAGIDLMTELLSLAAERGSGVFFLGARSDVVMRAAQAATQSFPNLVIGYRNGYFDDRESDLVCEEIRQSGASLLFVGMSSPRKERWLARYGHLTGAGFAMGVGGAFDVLGGRTKRAPRLLQRLGLEWAFRMAQEPRRLGPRYIRTNSLFLMALARAVVQGWWRGRDVTDKRRGRS